MNLLIDQREETTATPPPTEEYTYSAAPLPEEPVVSEAPIEHPVDYFDYARTGKTQRNYIFPIALIIILLVAIAAATYFGFFYKPGDLNFLTKIWKKNKPAVVQQPVVVTSPLVADTTKPVITPPKDTTSTVAAEPVKPTTPPPVVSGDKPIAKMAQTFFQLSGMIPSQVNVTTMVLDESSFSMEVTSDNKAAIENLFATVHKEWASDLTFSPASATAAVRGLITGSLSGAGADRTGLTVNPQTVVQELERTARAAELKVIEITEIKNMNQAGARRVPIFIKVRGSRSGFQTFCANVANQDWNLHVGKFILLNSQGESATYVLRLELMQS
jgi:hypothetical protein